MRCLGGNDANHWLSGIGLRLDNWNRIEDPNRRLGQNDYFIKYRAPRDAIDLYCFSQHVAGWLPRSDWNLFQIDNATALVPDEAFLISCLLCGIAEARDLSANRTFVFEFCNNNDSDVKTALVIANLIYVFLLFECHGYVVSSASTNGEILAVQDGFVYFLSRDPSIAGAQELIDEFEQQPLKSPKWVWQLEAN